MRFVVIGLGNPGTEYEHTRHNIGRRALCSFVEQHKTEFSEKKTASAMLATVTLKKHTLVCAIPETFMNKSGKTASALVKTDIAVKRLIVIYDDIDLPIGTIRIAQSRGSGGHKGIDSIIRAVKSKDFVRIRVGIAPGNKKDGSAKKPRGQKETLDFLMGNTTKKEEQIFSTVFKDVATALSTIVEEGVVPAMNQYN